MQNSPNNQKSYDEFFAEWKESIYWSIYIGNKKADKARNLNKTAYDIKPYGNDFDVCDTIQNKVVPANKDLIGKILSTSWQGENQSECINTSSWRVIYFLQMKIRTHK